MPALYTPLDTESLEIRILTLFPAPPSEEDCSPSTFEIRCSLSVGSLKDPSSLRYEALSYVWGDASDRRPIVVNGQVRSVTANLAAALRHLRSFKKSRRLWVDAICINQDDTAEKEIQVPLMGKIYPGASTVVAWLGEATPETDVVLQWANRPFCRGWGDAIRMMAKLNSHKHRRLRDVDETWFFQLYSGFLDISSRPYWTRMWTFQEFWVAEQSPVMVCGNYSCPFRALQHRGFYLELLYILERDHFTSVESQRYAREFAQYSPLSQRYIELGIPTYRNVHSRFRSFSAPSALSILAITSNRECQDKRDRIFALYSLMPDLAAAHPSDYKKSTKEVINDTVIHLVNNQDLGRALSHFLFQGELPEADDTLPSWRPDIMGPSRNLRKPVDPHYYSPVPELAVLLRARFKGYEIKLSGDEAVISLPAWSLGRCEIIHRLSDNEVSAIRELRDLVHIRKDSTSSAREQRWCATATFRSWRGRDRILRAAFAHTQAGEKYHRLMLYDPSDLLYGLDILPDFFGDSVTGTSIPKETSATLSTWNMEASCRSLPGKVLFSVMGRIGVTGNAIRDGDEIIVSPCLPYPIVLQEAENPLFRRMVLTAYVDGIMKNRFRDLKLLRRIRRLQCEMFQIC